MNSQQIIQKASKIFDGRVVRVLDLQNTIPLRRHKVRTDGFFEHRRAIDEPAVKVAMSDQVLPIATGPVVLESREHRCFGSCSSNTNMKIRLKITN